MRLKQRFGRLAIFGSLLLPLVLNSPLALAASEPQAWVGGLIGLSVPSASNTTSRAMYGFTGGAKLGSEYGVGAYYLSSTKDETLAGTKTSFNYDLYGAEFTYQFEGEAAGVYLGARLGLSKVTAGTISTSPFHWGPVAGFNHFLGSRISLGGELSWLMVSASSGTPTGSAVSQEISSFSMLNFLATLKFWF